MEERPGQTRLSWSTAKSFSRHRYFTAVTVAVCFILIYLVTALPYLRRSGSYQVGRPSPSTVTAVQSFKVEDPERTAAAREAERNRVRDLYLDPTAQGKAVNDLQRFFLMLESWKLEGLERQEITEKVRENFGLDLEGEQARLLLEASEETRRIITGQAVEIIASLEQEPISLENLELRWGEAQRQAAALPLDEEYREVIGDLAAAFLLVNTAYSVSLIYREMERAEQLVPPYYIAVSEGETLVQKGDVITPMVMRKLEESGALSTATSLQQMLGILLVFLGLTAALYAYLKRKKQSRRQADRVQLFYPVVLALFTLLAWVPASMAQDNLLWGFMVPVPLVALLTVLMLSKETALVMTGLATVIAGFLLKGDFYLTIAALMSGLVAVLFARRANRREDVLLQGLWISLAIGLVSFTTSLTFRDGLASLAALGVGAGNGLFCTVLALGLIPLLEKVTGTTTHIRLLELASPESPLLKELIRTAPGTYSHSLMLGNLAEAAAREVGADPLLARVGAYYHDVGKIKRPAFFMENITRDGMGHDNITPNLSALIIASHVKEGVELAQRYNLPQEIVDIIQQHHGTSVIKYFYVRAIESVGKEERVEQDHFRYPGEKPRSREAAIIMLADALEAATRALPRSTPVKLEQVIQNVIEERLRDGQLDECELTMQDLSRINRAFLQMTLGTRHERIQYPSLIVGGTKWRS